MNLMFVLAFFNYEIIKFQRKDATPLHRMSENPQCKVTQHYME